MELKTKYQHTYFIKPFLIKENKYEKYLLRLIKNKNCELKIFEKERDLNIYTHFLQEVRDYFFPSFEFSKEKTKKLAHMEDKMKASILSKLNSNVFEYKLEDEIQGKINLKESKGIFFNISKIEIICFDTGICFFIMKTIIEGDRDFSEVLDFNYKFKDINSDYYKLKAYNNIKIQTDKFGNMKVLSNFINRLIGTDTNFLDNKDLDIFNKRFFTYSYACIDQANWSDVNTFENIEEEFLKFTKILPKNYNPNMNTEEIDNKDLVFSKYEYARFGFKKESATFFASNVDIKNYTNLLFKYENEYLYTLIISLYQRIYLKKINMKFKSKKEIKETMRKFTEFTKNAWLNEITNSETGTGFYNNWEKVYELKELYNEIKMRFDVVYKEASIDKNFILNKILLICLGVSIFLNIFNLIMIIRLGGTH